MKVIETLWFTNLDGCIGIVVVEEDVTGDRKAYIGPASGTDEKADTEQILAWGNKFSLDTALRLRHLLKEKKEKKCDFSCRKTGEPLIQFMNIDSGGEWYCHLSCLREQLEIHEERLEHSDVAG